MKINLFFCFLKLREIFFYTFHFRLIGTVFEIFAKEKLGYDISIINVDNQDNIVIDTNLDTTFQKLSSCRNELWVIIWIFCQVPGLKFRMYFKINRCFMLKYVWVMKSFHSNIYISDDFMIIKLWVQDSKTGLKSWTAIKWMWISIDCMEIEIYHQLSWSPYKKIPWKLVFLHWNSFPIKTH